MSSGEFINRPSVPPSLRPSVPPSGSPLPGRAALRAASSLHSDFRGRAQRVPTHGPVPATCSRRPSRTAARTVPPLPTHNAVAAGRRHGFTVPMHGLRSVAAAHLPSVSAHEWPVRADAPRRSPDASRVSHHEPTILTHLPSVTADAPSVRPPAPRVGAHGPLVSADASPVGTDGPPSAPKSRIFNLPKPFSPLQHRK